MPEIMKQDEGVPATYPDAPAGLSAKAAALDGAAIWQRIEAYTARRWTPRAVIWIVEGCGSWQPPLGPVVEVAAEIWDGATWQAETPDPDPCGGLRFTRDGPHRVTATIGAGPVPAAVSEAFRRLAEYAADEPKKAGYTRRSINLGGDLQEDVEMPANWAARAIINSGAGDLLRPYRRA